MIEELFAAGNPLLAQLMAAARQGHLCIDAPGENLPPELVDRNPGELPLKPAALHRGRLYLQRNWVVETTIVKHLQRLREANPEPVYADPGSGLAEEQAAAVRHALQSALTVVSGGPGTGKTFTAARIVEALASAKRPLSVRIAAPTGKAADRLLQGIAIPEGVDLQASTLHRLLRLQPGRSRLFEQKPIPADLILVDEASMIDAALFAHLLAAVPSGARLVLLGDPCQLPPIDGGGIFGDLADLFAIRLRIGHRTQNAALHDLFDAARSGDVKRLYPALEPMPPRLFDWIESLGDVRVISPLRQGPFGVDAINRELLKRRAAKGRADRVPILITGNNPRLDLFNGTSGELLRNGEVLLADGRRFPEKQLPGYELAYAISAHKSQGSEFERVVCLVPEGSEEFGREALYTALTRAKKEVRLMGDAKTLEQMLSRKTVQQNGIRFRIR